MNFIQATKKTVLKPNKPYLSWRKGKKMVVLAKKGNGQTKVIHFGDSKMQDYLQHKDLNRRRNYLTRSEGIRDGSGRLTYNNIFSANYWSRRILWKSPY
jgi:hypothetical protein